MNDREKLVEMINHVCEGHAENLMQPYGVETLADHLIANGVAVQEWISVKDRVPDEGASVNVCCTGGYVMHALWRDRIWRNSYGCYLWANVTHWMPLPEPPKE